MRNWITVLMLLPICLFAMINSSEESGSITLTEPTEDIILATTQPAIEEVTVETTEPPIVDAEPPITEAEKQEDRLISLGTFRLTAYCGCRKCCGEYAENRPVDENGDVIVFGSIGVRLKAGVSIAVDPRVIPYRSQVVINGHTYIAHDTGGVIKGNRIDVYFDDHNDALQFGVQYAEVFIDG